MYGIGQNAIDWFVDYLAGRMQHTKVNGVLSESWVVKCSVPQGSILGPLMFILYINDIQNVITDCSLCTIIAQQLTMISKDRIGCPHSITSHTYY